MLELLLLSIDSFQFHSVCGRMEYIGAVLLFAVRCLCACVRACVCRGTAMWELLFPFHSRVPLAFVSVWVASSWYICIIHLSTAARHPFVSAFLLCPDHCFTSSYIYIYITPPVEEV